MHYWIDGYNLLFRFFDQENIPFEEKRKNVISFLEQHLPHCATLIFDGFYKKEDFASRYYFDLLNVIFTPSGQTADDYILEHAIASKKEMIVTSDKRLASLCRHKGCIVLSIEEFLEKIEHKKIKASIKEEKVFMDSKKNIERLLRIFEKKLKDTTEEC